MSNINAVIQSIAPVIKSALEADLANLSALESARHGAQEAALNHAKSVLAQELGAAKVRLFGEQSAAAARLAQQREDGLSELYGLLSDALTDLAGGAESARMAIEGESEAFLAPLPPSPARPPLLLLTGPAPVAQPEEVLTASAANPPAKSEGDYVPPSVWQQHVERMAQEEAPAESKPAKAPSKPKGERKAPKAAPAPLDGGESEGAARKAPGRGKGRKPKAD